MELTHNWDPEEYSGGRNFGHLAYAVDDIYAACKRLMEHGVTINRPPRDGRMAFVRSPDNVSIELLQKGPALRACGALEHHAECRPVVGRAAAPLMPSLEHFRGVGDLGRDLGARRNVIAGDHLAVALSPDRPWDRRRRRGR